MRAVQENADLFLGYIQDKPERKALCLSFSTGFKSPSLVFVLLHTSKKIGCLYPCTLLKQTARMLHKISTTFQSRVVANSTSLTEILLYTVLSPSI
jgi:hypothetical protein